MNRLLVLTCLIVLLQGCNIDSEYRALYAMGDDGERVWAFLHLNVPEEQDGLESYYYFAEISQALYQSVSQNQITEGFILLENVRYWGTDDLIYDYKDVEYSGEIVFRIEDIKRISLVNNEPKIGMGYEQYEAVEEQSAQSDQSPEATEAL